MSPREPGGVAAALRRPRVLIGIGCMLLATLIGAVTVQQASARMRVWQFRHPLAAGAVITPADVHVAAVAIDTGTGAYVAADRSPIGLVVRRDVAAGELLTRAALRIAATKVRLVTLPVAAQHYPTGLRSGQRVDVWSAQRLDQNGPVRAQRVATAALVAGVEAAEMGGGAGVLLQVTESVAAQIVAAVRSGEIDLVGIGAA